MRGLQVTKRAALEAARTDCERVAGEVVRDFGAALDELAEHSALPVLYPEIPSPAPPDETHELFRVATAQSGTEAADQLISLQQHHSDARTESGVPMLPLVSWVLLQNASSPAEKVVRAEKLARAAVETHPSILTPELLQRATRLLEEQGIEQPLESWKSRWEHDEQIRRVLQRNGERILAMQTSGWLDGEDENWWMKMDGEGNPRAFLPKSSLISRARTILRSDERHFPQYAAPSIQLNGVELIEKPAHGQLLARIAHGNLVAAALLTDPAMLYREYRKQSFWLGALLACAFAAALGGFWMMRRSLARERQLGELKSNFVASVSHELRAPIASMRVMAENLETGVVPDSDRRTEYHRLISEECRRLSTLIDNVLDFARIEQNRKSYRFAETDLPALVRETVDLMKPRAYQREQNIEMRIESMELAAITDGVAIQQALINLLDNAIKFSPPGTSIVLELRARDDAEWELSITDSGPGIPRADHAKIFERFYRLGSELRRQTQGAGIGLSIVEHIVHGHGGRIEVESEPGAGAKFILIFPCTPPAFNEQQL